MVKAATVAAKKLGVRLRALASGGGCDANVLAGQGFTLPNLGVGVRDCHTSKETLILKEFYDSCAIALATVLAYRK